MEVNQGVLHEQCCNDVCALYYHAYRYVGYIAGADRIAFIGLGNMGRNMAANLMKKGKSVSVFDVAPAAAEAMKGVGKFLTVPNLRMYVTHAQLASR